MGAFGAAAFVWAVIVLPRFWAEAAAFQAASRIIAGDVYSQESLAALASSLESDGQAWPRAAALGPASVIKWRQTEDAIARGEAGDNKSLLLTLDKTISSSLMGSPEASYQWMALYWTESRLHGFSPQYFQYLRMSYDAGPLEGWVAINRSRIALRLYAALPDDLKAAALTEFVGLVRSQFYADAADIFGNLAPAVRARLIAQLEQLKAAERQAFVKILYDKGYWEAPVPGVDLVPSRPWR